MSARAVVIGSGVDEMVAAHLLARRGFTVVLIPAKTGPQRDGWVPPQVIDSLGLAAHGLRVEWPDPWAVVPLDGGGRLELRQDMARTIEAIRAISARDAARWPEFCERMARVAGFLAQRYVAPPPDPLSLRFALSARSLGREGLHDLMRLLPMPIADLLDDWFESNALKGAIAAEAVRDLHQGPRSAGTTFHLLHRHAGSAAGLFRTPRSNLAEVLAGLDGVERRSDASVARVIVRDAKATGVVLASGEEIPASLVVSGLPPARTLLELADAGGLDPELARALRHVRSRPVSARVMLQLDRAPAFSRITLAPSLNQLEQAYDDAKHGRVSARPWLEASAEAGNRVEVHLQYVPSDLREDPGLADLALGLLAPHLQGASVTTRTVALPRDLGPPPAELGLDQALWRRPLPELARYRTPIHGLWLCGPSMYPGTPVAGAAGYLCAREILRGAGE